MSPGPSVLGGVTAVAPVPFDRIRQLMTVQMAHILLGLGPGAATTVSVDADPTIDTLVLQGTFWYRGEYTFTARPRGTEITYRIKNVSGLPDLIIRLWQRRTLRRQHHALDVLAGRLAARLA